MLIALGKPDQQQHEQGLAGQHIPLAFAQPPYFNQQQKQQKTKVQMFHSLPCFLQLPMVFLPGAAPPQQQRPDPAAAADAYFLSC